MTENDENNNNRRNFLKKIEEVEEINAETLEINAEAETLKTPQMA